MINTEINNRLTKVTKRLRYKYFNENLKNNLHQNEINTIYDIFGSIQMNGFCTYYSNFIFYRNQNIYTHIHELGHAIDFRMNYINVQNAFNIAKLKGRGGWQFRSETRSIIYSKLIHEKLKIPYNINMYGRTLNSYKIRPCDLVATQDLGDLNKVKQFIKDYV